MHRAYGDPNCVMMDIGRPNTAGFDRTRLPVRYYRVNFAQAQQLSRDVDPRSASFCRDVCDCGSMFQTLVEEVNFPTRWTIAIHKSWLSSKSVGSIQVPMIGGKLRSLVVAMTGGEYGAEDARKLFEALCKGIDASTHDAPLQLSNRNQPQTSSSPIL